ncbi:MAG: hypothetical protein ACI9EF_001016 [Pseudohongiellaceae bacterium]|jgi:hypothetical protein
MVWRLPQILMAMVAVLALGLFSVWFMEGRMGGATVPGLVLIEAPFADLEALEALGLALEPSAAVTDGSGGSALIGQCKGGSDAFEPFGKPILERLRGRGDTLMLYVPVGDGDPAAHSAASPAWQSILASKRPEDDGPGDRAAGLVASRQQLTGFCIGLVLAEGDGSSTALATDVVPHLLDAMAELPEFRKSSLVVLGAAVDGDSTRRHFLRVDRGPWKGGRATGLTDLLEGGW